MNTAPGQRTSAAAVSAARPVIILERCDKQEGVVQGNQALVEARSVQVTAKGSRGRMPHARRDYLTNDYNNYVSGLGFSRVVLKSAFPENSD
jgi:hypothetical protein